MTNPLLNERAMKLIEERLAVLNGNRGDPLEWALRRSHLKEVQALIGAEIARLSLVSANVTALEAQMTAIQGEIDAAETDIAAIFASLASLTTDGLPEGTTNLYHTTARVRATLLTGLSLASSTVIAATDSILVAMGLLQAQITLRATLDSPVFTGSLRIPSGTLAALGAPTLEKIGICTDASTTLLLGLGGVVTGGGANTSPVWADGTDWRYG